MRRKVTVMKVFSTTASTDVLDKADSTGEIHTDQEPKVRELRVKQVTWLAEGIHSITFEDPSGAALPTWKPGAHLSLRLPNGMSREYSLCSDPADTSSWSVAVLRTPDSRGGSKYVHDQLKLGSVIEVDGPRNNFELDDAGRYILIAGGIGITPIISMARRLESAGANWSILYAGKSRSAMAFLNEITDFPTERVTIHADDEANGQFPDIPGTVGQLEAEAQVYVCGPGPLMDTVENSMEDKSQLRLERFKAPEPIVAEGEEQSFDVVVNSTGERVFVGPDISILDALNNAGVDVPSSCEEGICGTCEVGVLAGDVEHRDFLLTEEEQESSMTLCVSRCRSAELIIDL